MTELIERIYEAAFVPERWNSVLQEASDLSASASAQIFFFSENGPPRGTTLENLRPCVLKICQNVRTGGWIRTARCWN